jgi:hypothetical protein
MVDSPAFTGLPTPLRQRVLRDVTLSLSDASAESPLPSAERLAVREILTETVPEFANLAQDRAVSVP